MSERDRPRDDGRGSGGRRPNDRGRQADRWRPPSPSRHDIDRVRPRDRSPPVRTQGHQRLCEDQRPPRLSGSQQIRSIATLHAGRDVTNVFNNQNPNHMPLGVRSDSRATSTALISGEPTVPSTAPGFGEVPNYQARPTVSMTGYENSDTGGSCREPPQRAKTASTRNSNSGRYPAPDGHGRVDQHVRTSRHAVLPNFTPLSFGDIVDFWMIKHCQIDADQRMTQDKHGEWWFTDKGVLRFHPNEYIRNTYGQDWPHGFYLEARDGLVTATLHEDNGRATVQILPIWTYGSTGAWRDDAETILKSAEFCASHLSIMNRDRVDDRERYEADIREELARNPNSTQTISRGIEHPTPNGHPYAPMDCVAVVNRLHPYDPKRNSVIRFSMSITVDLGERVRRHSTLEPESRIRTRDIYWKWFIISMMDPQERRTADYGPYTWLRGMDPSYTGSLHTPEIGTTNAAPPQVPTVAQQNGALPPSTGPAAVATPHQMSMVPHQNAAPPHPTGTLSSTLQQVSTMTNQNGTLPYPNNIINAAPPQAPVIPQHNGILPPPPSAKRKADDTEVASSVKSEQQAAVGNDMAKAKDDNFGAQAADDTEVASSVKSEQQAAVGNDMAKAKDDNFGAQAADSTAPLEPAQKRQKTRISAEDEADVDAGPKSDDADPK